MTFNGPRLNHALLPHPLQAMPLPEGILLQASTRVALTIMRRRTPLFYQINLILSLSLKNARSTRFNAHTEKRYCPGLTNTPRQPPLLDLHKYHHPLIVGVVSPYHHFIPCNSFPRGQKFWAAKEFSPASAAAHNFCPRLLLVIIISTNAFMLLKTWILFELLHRLVQHQKTVLVTRWLIN